MTQICMTYSDLETFFVICCLKKVFPFRALVTHLLQYCARVSTNSEGLAETWHDRSHSDKFRRSTACPYISSFVGINKFAENWSTEMTQPKQETPKLNFFKNKYSHHILLFPTIHMQKSSRNFVTSFTFCFTLRPTPVTNKLFSVTYTIRHTLHINGHWAQCSSTLHSIPIFNNICTVVTAHIAKSSVPLVWLSEWK